MINLPETKRIHELNRFALQIYGVSFEKLDWKWKSIIERVWSMNYHGVPYKIL